MTQASPWPPVGRFPVFWVAFILFVFVFVVVVVEVLMFSLLLERWRCAGGDTVCFVYDFKCLLAWMYVFVKRRD